MTIGLSDGQRVFAVRYATAERPPSLFHSISREALEDLRPSDGGFPPAARAVVSEPLSDLTDRWREIPASTTTILERDGITLQPFTPSPAWREVAYART
jgi:glutamine amidotransferase